MSDHQKFSQRDWDYLQAHQLVKDNIRALCAHFFPHGREVGHEYWIGNVAGDPGDSLKIELDDPGKKELFKDWATGEKGTFLDLLKFSRGWDLDQAIKEVCAALGVPYETLLKSGGANPADQYKSAGTDGTSGSNPAIDWSPYKLRHPKQLEELEAFRGYDLEFCRWAADRDYIGRDSGNWCTPDVVNGQLVGIHKRYKNKKGEWDWVHEPGGNGTPALIVGDLANADHVISTESTWDAFSGVSVLGIHYGENVAAICTRSCTNAKSLAGIQLKPGAKLYAIPQNDQPGQDWLDDSARIRSFKHVQVPPQFKDLNEWMQKGGSDAPKEFVAAFNAAKDYRAAAPVLIGFLTPSEIKAYKLPPNLVLAGDNHIIRGEPFVIGGEPGVGKSRVTVALAEAGATGLEWLGMKIHCRFSIAIVQTQNGRYRLQKEFANLDETVMDKYVRISPPPERGLCFGKQEFREQLKRFFDAFRPAVVILDPWSAVARDDKQKDYLEGFELVQETMPDGDLRPALGIVAHTRKPNATDRANRGRNLLGMLSGSLVLGSVPRTVWILQHASDSVTETRVVVTCSKNNNGELGDRTVWERGNGLWTPVTGFDWDAFDNPPRTGSKKTGGSGIDENTVASVFDFGYKALKASEAVAELMKLTGLSRAQCYRAVKLDGPHKNHLHFDPKTRLITWIQ